MERIGLTFNPSRLGSGATDDDLITVAKLADQLGDDVLKERLREAFTLYRGRASLGQVAEDFPVQYLATLEAAIATISVSTVRDSLRRIISEAAGS